MYLDTTNATLVILDTLDMERTGSKEEAMVEDHRRLTGRDAFGGNCAVRCSITFS